MVAAVLVTLAAATLLGFSSVLEQRITKRVPRRRAMSPRLLVDLARRPLWLAAIGVNIAGNALQILALHLGALALVQPLLVGNLLFAGLIAVLAGHRRADRVILAGVVCCVAGIAGFLAVARPSGGHQAVGFVAVLPLMATLAGVMACCLAAVRWGPRRMRSLWLALACGVDFGVTAFLLKLVPDTLPQGFGDPLRQWPLYLVAVTGPVGFLLNQNAFQVGLLIAPVLAVITAVDPLVSITIAWVWLGETIASTSLAVLGEAASLAVMTAGIIALAHRAPRAHSAGSRSTCRAGCMTPR